MKVEELKKVKLGNYPTPIQKLNNLGKVLGKAELYMKRDDVTGPAMGGNKTRKLEYLLHQAIEEGYTAVMTFGGTQTNHGRTTVGAAVQLGLKPILILGGDDSGYLSGNLTLDALMGADIYFNTKDSREDLVKEVIAKYETQGDKVYVVPVGGSSVLGAVGYVMAMKEIVEQVKRDNLDISYYVCPIGSMGTFAGTIIGAKHFNAPFKIIGVPVYPEDLEIMTNNIVDLANEISAEYDMGITITNEDVSINFGPDDAQFCGKEYNEPDPLTREYIHLLSKTEGIFTDPTYTGKVFRGFVEMIKDGTIPAGKNAMILHTGGVAALWTKEHLDDMQDQLRKICNITTI